ncbi:hypothetical protein CYLTODRAFT_141465 [Cylindrobasidium torrendii FP15055 ss-10]|uniref:Uncharacterized protein n=1 Tax=Cylindrobasidium torrendii FP15055 ss-10 TaxID=1314674 RepID=A0A0D7AY95_9AGAR|nr:hypothetical protein CYLTODRAFT_141465 [Cylindrobasidium torrendii FP15055 ss-10]
MGDNVCAYFRLFTEFGSEVRRLPCGGYKERNSKREEIRARLLPFLSFPTSDFVFSFSFTTRIIIMSATFTASIMSWAAAVQPGSPAPPTPATPATGKSAYTPTSAHHFDLTALGYTSVFVRLPKTPTAAANNRSHSRAPDYARLDDQDPQKLSPSSAQELEITSDDAATPIRNLPVFGISRARNARRRARASSMSAASPSRPGDSLLPSLMNELLIHQFISGGKIDPHMARALEQGAFGNGKSSPYCDEELEPLVAAPKKECKDKKRPAPLNIIPHCNSNVVVALPSAPALPTKKSARTSVRAFFSRS